MSVDHTSLERIRHATFPSSRRGYDKREVEKFLNRLADWLETGGSDEARSDTVKRELERVGQRTGAILAQAEESAQQIRGEAEKEARDTSRRSKAEAEQSRKEADKYSSETRSSADSYSEATRREADEYSDQTRRSADDDARSTKTKAEQDAHEMIEAAQAQAKRTVDEGVKRRKDIEAVISDLARRRDAVITQIEKLSGELAGAVRQHKPAPGADQFATPSRLDPLERQAAETAQDGEQAEKRSRAKTTAGSRTGRRATQAKS